MPYPLGMDNTTAQDKPQWIKDLEASTARFEALATVTGQNAQTFVQECKQETEWLKKNLK